MQSVEEVANGSLARTKLLTYPGLPLQPSPVNDSQCTTPAPVKGNDQ